MMAESTGGLDPYALTYIPAHIYSAGPAHYPRLYQLISSELWFQAQDRFDPTRRLYADSLSLGVRACAELPFPDGQSLLTPLMLVSLLRVTAASLASSIPAGAVEALNFFGEQHAADAYVQMQQDQVERCLSLCRLASAAHDFGDEGDAGTCSPRPNSRPWRLRICADVRMFWRPLPKRPDRQVRQALRNGPCSI